jgi:hypothetical protein
MSRKMVKYGLVPTLTYGLKYSTVFNVFIVVNVCTTFCPSALCLISDDFSLWLSHPIFVCHKKCRTDREKTEKVKQVSKGFKVKQNNRYFNKVQNLIQQFFLSLSNSLLYCCESSGYISFLIISYHSLIHLVTLHKLLFFYFVWRII